MEAFVMIVAGVYLLIGLIAHVHTKEPGETYSTKNVLCVTVFWPISVLFAIAVLFVMRGMDDFISYDQTRNP